MVEYSARTSTHIYDCICGGAKKLSNRHDKNQNLKILLFTRPYWNISLNDFFPYPLT